jgi:hypothetical protein
VIVIRRNKAKKSIEYFAAIIGYEKKAGTDQKHHSN